MQKNNRLSTILSLIAILLSLFVLFTFFRDRQAAPLQPQSIQSAAETPGAAEPQTPDVDEPQTPDATETKTPDVDEPQTPDPPETQQTAGGEAAVLVEEDGQYTSPEEVALYLHLYGHLPSNFITKDEATELGWVPSKNNLGKVAPGMSIGGDRFGNYEGLLPKGKYKECDVNFDGRRRGAERIVFSDDGRVYYTDDHYESFTQLY